MVTLPVSGEKGDPPTLAGQGEEGTLRHWRPGGKRGPSYIGGNGEKKGPQLH